MKNLLKLFTLIVFCSFIQMSCTKLDDDTSISDMTKAVIKGYAYANLDATNDTTNYYSIYWEKAPANSKIIARINASDLVQNPNPSLTYGELTYETTVGSDGSYTLEIPAGAKNVDVIIFANDFEYNQKIWDETQIIPKTKTVRRVYHLSSEYTTVFKNAVKIVDLYFDDNN